METCTKWDKIVSGEELAKIKTYRGKAYIEKKERRAALDELLGEGWEFFKEYKDNRFIGVRKLKKFDEQFEDRVWMLFAKMGFPYLNSDRHFIMSYNYQNPSLTQQIDVFAADEETVIIVECKASETIKDGVFKKPLEAFYGQMDGLRKEALKKYPGAKVKFIWATHNFILSNADQDKLKEWGILHFSDATIDYYYELVKHLGCCAKYQLLGNLFANTEIPNMDDRVPAIRGEMGKHIYYSFSIEPERLLKIGYVLHRNEANKNMMPTYQRLIKKKRLSEVQKFVNGGGYFPNSIIIGIETNGKDLQFDLSPTKVSNTSARLGILHLPKKYRSAYIIDGQHRLYGYAGSKYAQTNCIPVVAFVDLDRQEQIKLFMDINENQKAVPKTLRVTLNSDMLWDSKDYNERRQALRSKIAQMLGEEETSPLLGRVLMGEDEKKEDKCVTVEAIQLAFKRCQFLSQFDKKNNIVKDGTFDLGSLQSTCDILYPFIEACLKYIKKYTEEEWERGDKDNGVITINRGIQGIIRVINDIVNLLVERKEIMPKEQKTSELVSKVVFYLDPLITYFNSIDQQERKYLRGVFGGGADTRFVRIFQREIAKVRNDFNPEGLKEYWDNESKEYNNDALSLLIKIEICIKEIIRDGLLNRYGDNWIIKGVPKPIYSRVKVEADDKNYENILNGEAEQEADAWDFITLKDCKLIALNGNHWSEIFEDKLTRPEEEKLPGGKEAKTEWLLKCDTILNKLRMATKSYSVSTNDYALISAVCDWLHCR